jgi:GT2 family glycosyltransferase
MHRRSNASESLTQDTSIIPVLNPPLVSAVIVNRDGGRLLVEALESLFDQTWTPLEVILVDNASCDGSADAAAARYGERLRVIRNVRNEGFARGNNQAMAVAGGEWVFLLNNDAVLERVAIEQAMRYVADKPEAGMVACRVMVYDKPHIFDSTGLLLYPDGVCRPRGWEEKDLGQYDQPDEVLAPSGSACAFRRAMLDAVGCFDESYFAYLEDLDLGMRGQLAGWKCYYVPGAIARHAKSMQSGNHSKFKAYHVERNRIYNAVKLLPSFILLMSPLFTVNRYLLQFYAARTQRGLSARFMKDYSWIGLLGVLVRAHAVALVHLPEMIRKRRAIARTRRLSVDEWYRLISRFKLDAIELALKY